jgi:Flp pilus assembly protein TadD
MDRAIALNPNFADAYNTKGVIYTKMGRYDRANYDLALNAFNQGLALDASNSGIRLNIAIVYILMGDQARARQEYNRVDPQFQDALRGIIDEP